MLGLIAWQRNPGEREATSCPEFRAQARPPHLRAPHPAPGALPTVGRFHSMPRVLLE